MTISHDIIGTTGATPGAFRERSARTVRAELARLDAALVTLERSESLLLQARSLSTEDPRAAFELVHRAALRAAGVVIDEANRSRKRRLPLNAWVALSRCGEVHRAWGEEAAPLVAERARLAAHPDAPADAALLQAHLRMTSQRIAAVRAEVTLALLPPTAAAPLARIA